MSVDVLIKNGTVIDGSGSPRFAADVAISKGKIVGIGRLSDKAKQTIDAEGQVVSPGFVDGHTHMDAQIFWDPLGASSCYHGVTSVVMGNCGFTLAPKTFHARPCLKALPGGGKPIRNLWMRLMPYLKASITRGTLVTPHYAHT